MNQDVEVFEYLPLRDPDIFTLWLHMARVAGDGIAGFCGLTPELPR